MKSFCEWRNKECKDHVIFKLYFSVLAFILFFICGSLFVFSVSHQIKNCTILHMNWRCSQNWKNKEHYYIMILALFFPSVFYIILSSIYCVQT